MRKKMKNTTTTTSKLKPPKILVVRFRVHISVETLPIIREFDIRVSISSCFSLRWRSRTTRQRTAVQAMWESGARSPCDPGPSARSRLLWTVNRQFGAHHWYLSRGRVTTLCPNSPCRAAASNSRVLIEHLIRARPLAATGTVRAAVPRQP